MNKVSIPRLRSIRFKDGRAPIRVLTRDPELDANLALEWCQHIVKRQMENAGGIRGFAIVVWDGDGTSTCKAMTRPGSVPDALVPDFVRNRLLAEVICAWVEK